MGCCFSCCKKEEEEPAPMVVEGVKRREETPIQESAPTLEEVINRLKVVSDTTNLNEFVHIVKKLLEEKSDKGSTSESAKENKDMWSLFVTCGEMFLKYVNARTQKVEDKKDLLSTGKSKMVADVLDEIGELYWTVEGPAITSYLVENIEKVTANKAEVLELLNYMVNMTTTVINLRGVIPEEKENLKNASLLVVQGSIMCVCQISSNNLFSSVKTSVIPENLKEMSRSLHDLDLAIKTAIEKRQAGLLLVPKRFYPKDAVGIESAQKEVIKKLNMRSQDESLVVVIYGFGGLGKTTLATSVVAMLNLDDYNYARIQLDADETKNDFLKIQEIILKEAFPSFHSEATIQFSKEGRQRLKQAFQCPENKPVFLFIDNISRSDDLKELLPVELNDLPKRSRILVTTRELKVTDIFLNSGLDRLEFAIKALEDQYAIKILCKGQANLEIKDDMKNIMHICRGVPLALRIVRGLLLKMEYDAARCSQILGTLQRGELENLSSRLLDFVYTKLEDGTKDAFLDICCFFNGWMRRHVEYILGEQEVKSLQEVELVTPFLDDDQTLVAPFLDPLVDAQDMHGIYAGEERLYVHDIVKVKGRIMSTSTRFMTVTSFSEAAQDQTGLKGVKGIWFDDSSQYVLEANDLNSMSASLRVMSLGMNTGTSAPSRMKFKELRYLRVTGNVPHLPMKVDQLDKLGVFDGPIFPNWISMNQLPKRLSMIRNTLRSQIEIFATSEESSSTQGIQKNSLQELRLDGVKEIQFQGLNQLSSLKILSLLRFVDMHEFPEQVCQLSSLTKLKIAGWRSLRRLPQSFRRLKGLTHLEITDCSELEELPSSFGELKALEHLILSSCPKLKQLPAG